MKNYLKGIAATILIGLAAYAVINGVRLAERYVEAKELEARYWVENRAIIVDKKEKAVYRWDIETGEYNIHKN